MTRTDELRDRSIRELQGLLDSKERGRTIIPALSGDAEGNTEVSGSEAFMWVRPYHNDHSRLKAYNGGLVRNVAGIPLEVEIMSHPGSNPTARIIGRSYYGAPEWDDAQQGVSGTPVYVAKHALTHEARPGSGDDVVNIYTRALTELRADQQATPGLTVQVRAGTWYYGTALKLFAGGNSPAFAAPAAGYRWDLLYLASTNILTVKTGTAGGTLALAARPDPNADTLPVAYILLQSTTTAITDDLIYDARQLADQVLSSSLASHVHSGGPHTGTVIDTEVDDSSANAAEMQIQADPYPAGSPSLATDLYGELARLRYQLAQILGETYWYIDADATIAALNTLLNDHSARHENGGGDEISILGLSGLLADEQTPVDHDHTGDVGDGGQLDYAQIVCHEDAVVCYDNNVVYV